MLRRLHIIMIRLMRAPRVTVFCSTPAGNENCVEQPQRLNFDNHVLSLAQFASACVWISLISSWKSYRYCKRGFAIKVPAQSFHIRPLAICWFAHCPAQLLRRKLQIEPVRCQEVCSGTQRLKSFELLLPSGLSRSLLTSAVGEDVYVASCRPRFLGIGSE